MFSRYATENGYRLFAATREWEIRLTMELGEELVFEAMKVTVIRTLATREEHRGQGFGFDLLEKESGVHRGHRIL